MTPERTPEQNTPGEAAGEKAGRLSQRAQEDLIGMKARLSALLGASITVSYPRLVELAIERLEAEWNKAKRLDGERD